MMRCTARKSSSFRGFRAGEWASLTLLLLVLWLGPFLMLACLLAADAGELAQMRAGDRGAG